MKSMILSPFSAIPLDEPLPSKFFLIENTSREMKVSLTQYGKKNPVWLINC